MAQQLLADLAGVSQSYISKIEAGEESKRLSTLVNVAKALQVSVADLLGESPTVEQLRRLAIRLDDEDLALLVAALKDEQRRRRSTSRD
jgi:transcriptional regulator with XRE-family HTH domain